MERLTEVENGTAMVKGCGSNCKYGFEYCRKEDWENCQTISDVIDKLANYEKLEELIGIPLEELARIFRQHIPNGCQYPKKAIVLTDGDVDKWRKYKDLDEQCSLVNIPDEVYFIKGGQIQSGWVQEAVCSVCRKTLLDIRYDDNSLDSYRGYLGNEVFLTKAEAEAKLKELRGEQNDRE